MNRIVPVLLAVALAIVPQLLSGYQTHLLTEMLVFAALAMSIDILAGYAGRTPLCHGAIFGVATYVALYYTNTMAGSPWIGLALGVAAATAVAAVFALLAVRTTGVYFLLLTLALGMIVWGICQRWTSVTGGENGIRGSIKPDWLEPTQNLYYFVLLIVAAMAFAMWRIVHSPFGITLRGIKDSESRMRALGYNVPLHLFIAFTLSGFFAGVAGGLYAFLNSFVSPSTVNLSQSVTALLMTIVGGVGTLFGGLLGSVLVISLQNAVSMFTERWPTVLGLVFVITMIFAPEGVLGRIRRLVSRDPKPATRVPEPS
ncbi:MAG: branched-chain amino acid ABC transporter permease [Lautropia sp.]